MKRYENIKDGAIHSVELSVTPESLQACIQLRDKQSLPAVKEKLGAMGYSVVSDTTVNQAPMLVAVGPRNEAAFIEHLSSIDGPLNATKEKKPFDAWKTRSLLGIAGQMLQLTSAFMKHKVDAPQLTFSASNMTASGINLIYKAQKHDDPHQLRALKEAINQRLMPLMDEGAKPVEVDDHRAILRERNRPKAIAPLDDAMRKNSVYIGEFGLRYGAALSLALPARDWPAAFKEGRLPKPDPRSLRVVAGTGSLIGKTIAVSSKIPDPYNPQPQSWLDKIREKYTFITGGLIEAGAFSTMAYDSLVNTAPVWKDGVQTNSHSLKIGKHYTRDYLGALGSALFVGGYVVRSWAKFGERNVDMPELYAHASDMISRLPPDKIPQALADTSAFIADHFKNKPGLSYGVVYNKLSDDLGHEHHITINPSHYRTTVARNPQTGIEVTQIEHSDQSPNTNIKAGDVEHKLVEMHAQPQRA